MIASNTPKRTSVLHGVWILWLAVVLVLSGCVAPMPGTVSESATGDTATATLPELDPNQEVTIVFENYNLASVGIGRDATMLMLEEFKALHPNITVETKASQDIMPSVQAAVAAGNPPDVAQVFLREWDIVVNNMAPTVLEDIVPAEEWEAHIEGIYPRAMNLTRRNGKTYGMPYVFSTPTLFYNATLFEEAGLDPNDPPATYEDVKEVALQIKEQTGKEGIYIACIELDWCTQAILRSNGGYYVSPDSTRIMFGEPEAVEAIAIWQDLVESGAHANLSGADAQEAFMAGNLAMFVQTSALQGSIMSAAEGVWELKSAGMPTFGDKPVVPTNSGSGLAILTTDPIKQRASWELVKFLTSERAFTIIASQIGYLTLRPSTLESDEYLKGWIAENPLMVPNLEQLANLEPSVAFPGPNHVQIRDIFIKALQEVLLFGADPTTTMQDAQARGQELMPAN